MFSAARNAFLSASLTQEQLAEDFQFALWNTIVAWSFLFMATLFILHPCSSVPLFFNMKDNILTKKHLKSSSSFPKSFFLYSEGGSMHL